MVANEDVIFLVEDNHDDELLTLRALKKGNIADRVVVARDGVEALDFLFGRGAYADRDVAVPPQIILLDLNLPRMGGLEVLRLLRSDERTRLLPVVVLTSSQEDEDVINSFSNGANAYVRKPVEFERIAMTVKSLGVMWP
jgi:two-component system, response regulator